MVTAHLLLFLYMVSLISLFVGVSALFGGLLGWSAPEPISPELNLAELSPSGEPGGYAVPASGASGGASTCTASLTPTQVANPSSSATFSWDNTSPWELLGIRIYRCDTGTSCSSTPGGTGWTKLYERVGTTSWYRPGGNDSGDTAYRLSGGPTDPGSISVMPSVTSGQQRFVASMDLFDTSTYGTGSVENSQRSHSAQCSAELTIAAPGSPPTVTLEVRELPSGTFSIQDLTIDPADNVELKWTSVNATNCVGSGFSTGPNSPPNGTQSTVTEPPPGSSRTYSVNCQGPGGSAWDSLKVTTTQGTRPPDISSEPPIVRPGDPTTITWDTDPTSPTSPHNPPANCTLTGAGVPASLTTGLSGKTGSVSVIVNNEAIFTLTCPGGSDRTTVRVLPVIQET